jgi:hypothetical protein
MDTSRISAALFAFLAVVCFHQVIAVECKQRCKQVKAHLHPEHGGSNITLCEKYTRLGAAITHCRDKAWTDGGEALLACQENEFNPQIKWWSCLDCTSPCSTLHPGEWHEAVPSTTCTEIEDIPHHTCSTPPGT